jgi:hypothetical protein
MITKLKPIGFICTLFWVSAGFAPPDRNTCIAEVKFLYQQIGAMDKKIIPEDKAYYSHYIIRTATEDSSKDGISENEFRVWVGKKQTRVLSSALEMYSDSKDIIAYLPSKKMVVLNDASLPKEKERADHLRFLRDTVFSLCDV